MAPSAIKDHGVTRHSAFLKRTAPICSALVAACLLYAALVSMANGLRLARQPYQFDYEEGNVLNAAVRMGHCADGLQWEGGKSEQEGAISPHPNRGPEE